ncbi:hypothetical protein V6N13_097473 [Hibiscus sabdariffa]|uniref:Uncharacterized protein n=1 Tax=Hibiscus sabdariffa TaxID=183260 RepID=A0ABR2PCT4_9ROSI
MIPCITLPNSTAVSEESSKSMEKTVLDIRLTALFKTVAGSSSNVSKELFYFDVPQVLASKAIQFRGSVTTFGVMSLEDFFGHGCRRNYYSGCLAKFQCHNVPMDLGKFGKGLWGWKRFPKIGIVGGPCGNLFVLPNFLVKGLKQD